MRPVRLIKLMTGLVVVGIFVAFTLFSGALYTYSVLTEEALVAELQFTQLGPQHFEAQLATDNGCTLRTFEIYGDQWRLDANFLKWHSWATLLGFDAYYRLSRLEGRYADISQQNNRRNVAWSLADEQALDIVDLASQVGSWNVFVDSTYGSSTFQDMDTESVHRVYRTQTGLIARMEARPPEPRDSARQPAGSLQVNVLRACGGEPGTWQRFTMWADRSAGRLLGRRAER